MTEPLEMIVTLEIYNRPGEGSLRLTERVRIAHNLTLAQAAEILTRFSELAKAVSK